MKQQIVLKLQQDKKEIDDHAEAQKKMFEEAAKKRQDLQDATIVETGRQLAKLEHETEEFLADLNPSADPAAYAQTINGQTPPPKAASNVTMIPVVPGNIIHSNNVNPDEMATRMLQNPEWQQLGFSCETGILAVKLLLTQLQTKSLTVEPAAPSLPADIQTLNMQADAEAKRKAEEGDDEYTDESLDEEEEDLDDLKKREGDKPAQRRESKEGRTKKGQVNGKTK